MTCKNRERWKLSSRSKIGDRRKGKKHSQVSKSSSVTHTCLTIIYPLLRHFFIHIIHQVLIESALFQCDVRVTVLHRVNRHINNKKMLYDDRCECKRISVILKIISQHTRWTMIPYSSIRLLLLLSVHPKYNTSLFFNSSNSLHFRFIHKDKWD